MPVSEPGADDPIVPGTPRTGEASNGQMMQPLQTSRPAISADTSDGALVERAVGGEVAAFEAIMRRHNRLLFRTARSILKNDTDSEDALQEAYLRAWRALPGFRAEAKLSTWLVRIVVNQALGMLRHRSAEVIPFNAAMETAESPPPATVSDDAESGEQPEEVAMQSDVCRLIESRIDTLPDAFRTVFVLRAVEELSVEEVATALDIPAATVRSRFFRARSMLREALSSDIDLATGDAFSFAGERCNRIVATVLARL